MSYRGEQGAAGMTESDKLKGLLGAIGSVLFLAFAKYGPPFFFGLIVGLLMDLGARRIQSGWPRARSYLLSLLFFACVLFVLIGLPVQVVPPKTSLVRFPGLLWSWDGFARILGDGVRFWNQSFGMILQGTRIRPEKWTEVTVSQYFWISWIGAWVAVVLRWGMKTVGLGGFQDSDDEDVPSQEITRIFSLPAHALWVTYFMSFRVWVDQAREIGRAHV